MFRYLNKPLVGSHHWRAAERRNTGAPSQVPQGQWRTLADPEASGKPHRNLELVAESESMDFAAALKPGGTFTDEKQHLGLDEGYNYWCFQQVFVCVYSDVQ